MLFPASGARVAFALLFFSISATLGVLTFGALTYTESLGKERFAQALQSAEERSVAAMSAQVRRTLYSVTTDLLLVRDAVEQTLRGRLRREDLEMLLLDFAQTHPAYDQVRYLDGNGIEIARVNDSGGGPYLVASEALQDKSATSYIQAAGRLNRDAILITPIDANRERGKIQYPIKAVMRVAAPIYDAEGERAGTAIINFKAANLLQKLISVGSSALGSPTAISAKGRSALDDFRAGTADSIAIDGKAQVSFADRHPTVWQAMQETTSGSMRDESGGLFTYIRFEPTRLPAPPEFNDPVRWEMPIDQAGEKRSGWYLAQHVNVETLNAALAIGAWGSPVKSAAFIILIISVGWTLALRIASLRLMTKDMSEVAGRDDLTGLLSRGEFERRLADALSHAHRFKRELAVLIVDLNDFKAVNDTMGHAAGDVLLRYAGERLQKSTRKSDFVGRVGGDEFAVVLTEIRSSNDIEVVTQHIRERLADPVIYRNRSLKVIGSIGAAHYPKDGENIESLTRAADAAMYADKEINRAKKSRDKIAASS